MSYPATKTLHTKKDYREAMARLEELFPSARKGTPEGDEFELLSLLISDWEDRNVIVERSKDPIGLILFAMENQGLKVADLAPVMARNRASEILNRKRALTITMIRWFHENLHLPLEVLTLSYPLSTGRARPRRPEHRP